jgi:UDP-N-acetylglucosamine 1-carboxyvinyltransferase
MKTNSELSQRVIVRGGRRLVGSVIPIPNKNSILSALPACLLTSEDVIYNNVPKSTDVETMLEIIRKIGGDFRWVKDATVIINTKKVNTYKIDKELGSRIRASLLFAGPLLARFGMAEIPIPGGCVLGKRSIAAHIDVFSKLGIVCDFVGDFAKFSKKSKGVKDFDIWQNEASVTATENFALYASGTNGEFSLTDAACEPHVKDLLDLLFNMGAVVAGSGSNKIKISGGVLKGATYNANPDFVDIGGFIVAAAVTKGKITIKGGNIPSIVSGIIDWFSKFNIKISYSGSDLLVDGDVDLRIDLVNSGFPMAFENIPKFVPRPWPGFPVDVLPPVVTLACKAFGSLFVNNWMYESGMGYCDTLVKLGANIKIMDPQKSLITGPCTFIGGNVTPPQVIQACKAVFLASLCDNVETTINGFDILKRRYPDIVTTYKKLGADIEIL